MKTKCSVELSATVFLSIVAPAAGLAACSSPSVETWTAPAAPAPRPANFIADASRRAARIYVADHKNKLIDVFNRQGQLQYTITGRLNAPAGLFIDARHNLWVANPGANDVLVYARGTTTPFETLHDRNQPNDVALCSDGTAFVADSLNAGGVAVFPPGHSRPTRRLEAQQSGVGGLEFYVTCDRAGNIFATGFIGTSPFPATAGWRHGRQSGYYLLPEAAWSNSGIKATETGTLLIATYAGSRPAVVEFTEKGIPTGNAINTGSGLWSDIALDARQNAVFGADTNRDTVVARKFPSGTVLRTYANGNDAQPEGVAVDPGD